MAVNKKTRKLRHFWIFPVAVLLALCVVAACVYALRNINRSQYRERVNNSNILMEKICHHIETAVDFNWERTHYVIHQLENESFDSVDSLLDYIHVAEQAIKGDADTKLLLISDDGTCYVSGGHAPFKWMAPALLNDKNDVMYISDYQFASRTQMQMHYLSRFSVPIVADGISFTHVSLACNMDELDSFFDISNYGEESITFIIHEDGSQVYRQEKHTIFSGIYNLLSALKDAQYNYGTTHEKVKSDIQNGINDTIHLNYKGTNYFTSYYRLAIKDWTVVLMVPEEYVGTGTQAFAQEIIWSVLLLIGSVVALLLCLIFNSMYQISRRQKEVNDQLGKAMAAEHAANKAKTSFLSSMSHDIRTPMNAIVGMTEIASKRTGDPAYMEDCLRKIKLASGHLLTLINDILDISKIESGKMMLTAENFSILESFDNLMSIMQPSAQDKKHELVSCVHDIQYEFLHGDKLRLNQIFINLLGNAIKYTEPKGNIRVDLSEESIPGNDQLVRIRYVVQDNGIGMSQEFQQSMYLSFSRATDSRISKIQGSGLGLAICKQMVELMGGSIECESALGKGTVFTVTIDLPIADDASSELSAADGTAENTGFDSLRGSRILVAEDNDLNWEIAHTLLDMYGVCAFRAENGLICTQMLEEAEKDSYDLVLMDVRMPVMDGRKATRLIRQSSKAWIRELPVIAMTADAFAEDIQECLDAGMNEHIPKPLDMERLLHVLQATIQNKEKKHV